MAAEIMKSPNVALIATNCTFLSNGNLDLVATLATREEGKRKRKNF
jgi:hypothetical protein